MPQLQADPAALASFDSWPLVPLACGRMCLVKDRFAVFTPPVATTRLPANSRAPMIGLPSPAAAEGSMADVSILAPAANTSAPHAQAPSQTDPQVALEAPDHRQVAPEEQGVWTWLLPLVCHVGLPVLDSGFASCAPLCEALCAAGAADRILNKLRLCSQQGLLQVTAFAACDCAHAFRERRLLH